MLPPQCSGYEDFYDQNQKPVRVFSSEGYVPYPAATGFMEEYVHAIHEKTAAEAVWFLEHSPVYTAGTSADAAELLDAGDTPVFTTGRGGKHTYHGPGQLIVYCMINLAERGFGVKEYVKTLEEIIIQTLADIGIVGERRDDRIGVWVCARNSEGAIVKERKIAALGVRVRRGVAFHGFALNVNPDLKKFSGIVPCGIREYGVTSVFKENINKNIEEIKKIIKFKLNYFRLY